MTHSIKTFQQKAPPEFAIHKVYDSSAGMSLDDFIKKQVDSTIIDISPGTYTISAKITHTMHLRGTDGVIFVGTGRDDVIVSISKYLILENIHFDQKGVNKGSPIRINGGYTRVVNCVLEGNQSLINPIIYCNGTLECYRSKLVGSQIATLLLDPRSVAYCEKCFIGNSQQYGISCKTQSYLFLNQTRVTNNGRCGMMITDYSTAIIMNSIISFNKFTGIEMTSTELVIIKNSKVTNNNAYGLDIKQSNVIAIQTTVCENTRGNAIMVHKSSYKSFQCKYLNSPSGGLMNCIDSSLSLANDEFTGKCQSSALILNNPLSFQANNINIHDVNANGIIAKGKFSLKITHGEIARTKFNGLEAGGDADIQLQNLKFFEIGNIALNINVNVTGTVNNCMFSKNSNDFQIISSYLQVSNTTFEYSKKVLGLVQRASKPIFENCIFNACCEALIAVYDDKTETMFSNCEFISGCDVAVQVASKARANFDHCRATFNPRPDIAMTRKSPEGKGIIISSSMGTFNNCDFSNFMAAISFNEKSTGTIDYCTIANNLDDGVKIQDEDTKVIINNTSFLSNKKYSLIASKNSHGECHKCTFRGGNINVVSIAGATMECEECEITSSTSGESTLAYQRGTLKFTDCVIADEQTLGIKALENANVILKSTTVSRCSMVGVFLNEGATLEAVSSVFESNGNYGIALQNKCKASIVGCIFSNHNTAAISSSNSEISNENNQFRDNQAIIEEV